MENSEFQALVEQYVITRDNMHEDLGLKDIITSEVYNNKIDISIKSILHPYTIVLANKRFNISFLDFKSEGMIVFLRCLRLYKVKNNNNFYGYFYFGLKRRLNQIVILANRKTPIARMSMSSVNEYAMILDTKIKPKITRIPIVDELEELNDRRANTEEEDDVFFSELNNFPRLLKGIKDDLCKKSETEDLRDFILNHCSEKAFVEQIFNLKCKNLKTFASESNNKYKNVVRNLKKIAKEVREHLDGELCCR